MLRAPSARAFTLVELLITTAIIGVLIALMLPAIGRTLGAAKSFRCQMSLRNVAFDFQVFADDRFKENRGDDSATFPFFRLETFMDAEYGLDEFWAHGDGADLAPLEGSDAADRMTCAEVGASRLTARRGAPCASGALSPSESISYGFNIRLHRAEVQGRRGPYLHEVRLNTAILAEGDVPLVWDIDGAAAAARDANPVFSGPSMDSAGPFAGDRYWYPGMRHGRSMNIAFIDGHVASTAAPLAEGSARWSYQPRH